MRLLKGIFIIYCLCQVKAAKIPSPPAFIFSKGHQICSYNDTANTSIPHYANTFTCFWEKNNIEAAIFDIYLEDNVLILAHRNKIDRLALDQPNSAAAKKFNGTLVSSTGTISGLSVDFITGNIYFIDLDTYNVDVTNSEGEYAITIHRNLTGIYGIAVDPINRYIFWTSLLDTVPSIGRSSLDGTNKIDKLIVGPNVILPHYICIDHHENRIYWTDFNGGVQTAKIDGTDHRVILHNPNYYPHGITVSKSQIIWTENKPNWKDSRVHWTSKASGSRIRTDRHSSWGSILDVVYYSNYSQPKGHTNACSRISNGGCSQLCIPITNTTRTCKCSLGFMLGSDGRNCVPVPFTNYKNALFIADTGRGQIYAMDPDTNVLSVLPIPRQLEIRTLVIDPVEENIFWSNAITGRISKASIFTGVVSNIKNISDHNVTALALDYKRKMLFYANKQKESLHSITYSGANKYQILEFVQVLSMVADVQYQKLYMTVAGSMSSVRVISYDGQQRSTLVVMDSTKNHPFGLTIDFERNTMYWIQHGLSSIRKARLDGTGKQTIFSPQKSFKQAGNYPPDLALHGSYVYIADWKLNNHLNRIPIDSLSTSTKMIKFGTDDFLHTSSITTFPTMNDYRTTTLKTTTIENTTDTLNTTADYRTTTISTTGKTTTANANGGNAGKVKDSGSSTNDGGNKITIAVAVTLSILALVLIAVGVAVFLYCRNKDKLSTTSEPAVAFENPGYAEAPISRPYKTLPNVGADGNSAVNINFDERENTVYEKLNNT